MKRKILSFLLSLVMICSLSAVNFPTSVQAATNSDPSLYDLKLSVFLDSLENSIVKKTENELLTNGGFAIYPNESTTINYKVVVASQTPSSKDITVQKIVCYYNADLTFIPTANIKSYESNQVNIGSNEFKCLVLEDISLSNVDLRNEMILSFKTPSGYDGVFESFYCEIAENDEKYVDEDSTPNNAVSNGEFSFVEDDATAFINDENLLACPYGIKYEVSSESVKIVGYIGDRSIDTLYIPSAINGLPVTDIGSEAFSSSLNYFKKIYIPSSIVNIWPSAFRDNSYSADENPISKKDFIISEGLTWIGAWAFYGSEAKTINLPSTVNNIRPAKILGNSGTQYEYYSSFLSSGLNLYSELPSSTISNIYVIKDSYAETYLKNIKSNDIATFSDLITYGEKIYTVNYNHSYNGGNWQCVDVRLAQNGDMVDLDLKSEKDGRKFIGWNTTPTAKTGLKSLQMGNQDVTLYAIYNEITSISIVSQPNKVVYELGESLNTSGLKLMLTYSDGSTEYVTAGFTVDGFDSFTAGEKNITVTYSGKSTTLRVTVNSVSVDENAPSITVQRQTGRIGNTVLVTVALEKNPGIWGMDLVVNYDKTQLTLSNVTNGTVFNSTEWTPGNLQGEKYILSYEASGFDNITTNGILATLEFNVKETATVDSFSSISLIYNAGDIINVGFDDIDVVIVSGGISIVNFVYGDLNSDGLINKKDSLLMKMYLADNETSIDKQAADVYVDGSINKKDSLYLKQYLAGLDVELGA